MKYRKIEEFQGDFLLVYFTDNNNLRQGELLCYKTEGKLPMNENLLYTEVYKNGVLLERSWNLLLPDKVRV